MTPLELVEQISEGIDFAPNDLDTFLVEHPVEGQHLDYKSGMLADDGQGSAKLRRHVTGMANAEGGVLILGVRDDRSIDGINPKGGRSAKCWAENCISILVAQFTTPPHCFEIVHEKGTVLVVAIHRNGRLIPVVESGRTRYYLRLGEHTLVSSNEQRCLLEHDLNG